MAWERAQRAGTNAVACHGSDAAAGVPAVDGDIFACQREAARLEARETSVGRAEMASGRTVDFRA
ncbi:hypothetical protein [Dokdonella sp.]|uniref:hypothetical protein n=1 Tax=Dokdonella sp. TaxID=2291710 RepID=UPI0031C12301|nr:hypothetical protein [Dokdonella sp.]